MNKELAAKTATDQQYLRARGWRFIGQKRMQYGWHYYWDRWEESAQAWSKQYIQGDAVDLQHKLDKEERMRNDQIQANGRKSR